MVGMDEKTSTLKVLDVVAAGGSKRGGLGVSKWCQSAKRAPEWRAVIFSAIIPMPTSMKKKKCTFNLCLKLTENVRGGKKFH